MNELINLATKKGYNILSEYCQYTNKLQYVVFLGEYSSGIFTTQKGNKQHIKKWLSNKPDKQK